MAITYGFYNSVNHDRKYFAEDMSRILDGVISEGVFSAIGKHYSVTANGGNTVLVESGNAWFNHTWTYNDSQILKELQTSDVLNDRIDAIVIEVNRSDEVRENSIKVVTGVASSTPEKPEFTKTDLISQHPIAYISRKANSTEILQSDITSCVGTEECPYVTGPASTVSADDLLKQWQGEFDEWIANVKASGDKIIEDLQPQVEEKMNEFINQMTTIKDYTTKQIDAKMSEFNTWYNSIKDQIGISKSVAAQASASDWSGNTAPYVNTVSVVGVTDTNVIDVGLASYASDDQVTATMAAAIAKITQTTGSITLYSYGTKPTIDIPLTVVIRNYSEGSDT